MWWWMRGSFQKVKYQMEISFPMDIDFYIASILGFLPSFGILYTVWGKLEGYFNEKSLFFSYFIGWIMGIIIAVFFLIIKSSVYNTLDLSILSLLFFAIFTEMFKFIYLNMPSKRDNRELPYYGFSLGLGIGAIWSVAIIYQYFRAVTLTGGEYLLASVYFLLFSLSLSSIHASTGTWLGEGILKRNAEASLMRAFLLQMLFNLTLLPLLWGFPPLWYLGGIIIAIPVLYYKVYKGYLLKVKSRRRVHT